MVKKAFLVYVIFIFLVSFSQAQDRRRVGLDFDVTDYRIEAQIFPDQNRLQVVADVTFTPLTDTRTIIFELNGSLKVENIEKPGAVQNQKSKTQALGVNPQSRITFIQDQVGVSEIGPNVRIDLGEVVPANQPITLRFKYGGVLTTPQGGPLLAKRLAYIGDRYGYLMYASRWFPFHDYAADRATADITISLPKEFTVVGYSDTPPVQIQPGRFRFVQLKPSLIGNFAYSNYFLNRNFRFLDYEITFYINPGSENLLSSYGELIGKCLDFYTKQYGRPDQEKRYFVIQSDDETLDFYSAPGMVFISDRFFEQQNQITQERLPREIAYQWWGFTVGLKSFDDAWLSQGLAEFSSLEFREVGASEAKIEEIRRELLEKALAFEQVASLLRAPSTLDDTSTAYQYIMFAKGAFVFRLLRETLGKERFDLLLRSYLENFRGKNASIEDFENLTSKIAGQPMRYFFARWVESTGAPEFMVDYIILRTKDKKFITRGTVRQNYSNLRLSVDIQLIAEGETKPLIQTVMIEDTSADFNIESETKPVAVVIDPKFKLLRISDELRVSALARRGIELFKEGSLADAQQQLEAALKLDRSNTWVYYNLGLIYLEQRNYDLAIDNFKVITQGDRESARPQWIYVWSFIKLGNAYDAKGDRTRAVDAYKRAIDVGDNYDNAQEAAKKYMAEPYDPRRR
jgi:tetratricopeptide (TPR) repeat protein